MAKRLLVADDSATIRRVVALSLSHEPFEIINAQNGDECLAKAREARPDLLIVDYFMPHKSGYEVVEETKKDPALRSIPVLLLSGTFEQFDEERAKRAGADAWIAKPFDSAGFIDKINALLGVSAPKTVETTATLTMPAVRPVAAPPPGGQPLTMNAPWPGFQKAAAVPQPTIGPLLEKVAAPPPIPPPTTAPARPAGPPPTPGAAPSPFAPPPPAAGQPAAPARPPFAAPGAFPPSPFPGPQPSAPAVPPSPPSGPVGIIPPWGRPAQPPSWGREPGKPAPAAGPAPTAPAPMPPWTSTGTPAPAAPAPFAGARVSQAVPAVQPVSPLPRAPEPPRPTAWLDSLTPARPIQPPLMPTPTLAETPPAEPLLRPVEPAPKPAVPLPAQDLLRPVAPQEVRPEVPPAPPAIPAEAVTQAVRTYLEEHQRMLAEVVSEPIRAHLRDEPSAIAAVVRAYLQEHREVIEQVVWEVVPDLAETLVREEIARLLQDKAS